MTTDATLGCLERCYHAMPGRGATCAYVCGGDPGFVPHAPPSAAVTGPTVLGVPATAFAPIGGYLPTGGAVWHGWDMPDWHSAYPYRPNNGPIEFVPGRGAVLSDPRRRAWHRRGQRNRWWV